MLISIRGTRLNIEDIGEGQSVVLLHGLSLGTAHWDPQVADFAQTHRVITMDMRGFGLSDKTYGEVTVDDYAADVCDVIRKLDISDAVLVGQSMGGNIAQTVALEMPERVTGLVLANSNAIATDDSRKNTDMAQGLVLEHGMRAFSEVFVHMLLAPEAIKEDRPCYRQLLRSLFATDPFQFVLALRAIAAFDQLDRIAGITAPTLVLSGTEDLLNPPADSERIHEMIKQSEYESIEGAAHLIPMDHPDEFNAAVRTFLASLS